MQCVEIAVDQVESNDPGEDRISIRCRNGIQAICVVDGHGGYLACDIASWTLLDSIIDAIIQLPSQGDAEVCDAISQCFSKVDQQILSEAVRWKQNLFGTSAMTLSNKSKETVDSGPNSASLSSSSSSSSSTSHGMEKTDATTTSTHTVGESRVGTCINLPTTGNSHHISLQGTKDPPTNPQNPTSNHQQPQLQHPPTHWKLGVKDFGRAGACIVVAVIVNSTLYIAHLGDCRAVLFRQDTRSMMMVDATNTQKTPTSVSKTTKKQSQSQMNVQNGMGEDQKDKAQPINEMRNSCANTEEFEGKEVNLDSMDVSQGNGSTCGTFDDKAGHHDNDDDDNIADTRNVSDHQPVLLVNSLENKACAPDSMLMIENENSKVQKLSNDITTPPSHTNNVNSTASVTETTHSDITTVSTNTTATIINTIIPDDVHFTTSDPLLDELKIHSLPSTSHSSGSNSLVRKKARPDIGGDNFSYRAKGIEISSVTTDHCCAVEAECKVVQHLTKDPNPLRKSANDQLISGNRAPNRVGGSLAVTRALGDGYLKVDTLSAEPYQEFLPYIHSRPTIHYKKLAEKDVALILASDGLFNYMTAKECANVLSDEFAPATAATKKRKRGVGGGMEHDGDTDEGRDVNNAMPIPRHEGASDRNDKKHTYSYSTADGSSVRLHPDAPLSWNSHEPVTPPSTDVAPSSQHDSTNTTIQHTNNSNSNSNGDSNSNSNSNSNQNTDIINSDMNADANTSTPHTSESSESTAATATTTPSHAPVPTSSQSFNILSGQNFPIGFRPSCKDILGNNLSPGSVISKPHNVARKLVEECIKNAAINSNMTSELLMSLGRGGKKREIIDDVTVAVIKFGRFN